MRALFGDSNTFIPWKKIGVRAIAIQYAGALTLRCLRNFLKNYECSRPWLCAVTSMTWKIFSRFLSIHNHHDRARTLLCHVTLYAIVSIFILQMMASRTMHAFRNSVGPIVVCCFNYYIINNNVSIIYIHRLWWFGIFGLFLKPLNGLFWGLRAFLCRQQWRELRIIGLIEKTMMCQLANSCSVTSTDSSHYACLSMCQTHNDADIAVLMVSGTPDKKDCDLLTCRWVIGCRQLTSWILS